VLGVPRLPVAAEWRNIALSMGESSLLEDARFATVESARLERRGSGGPELVIFKSALPTSGKGFAQPTTMSACVIADEGAAREVFDRSEPHAANGCFHGSSTALSSPHGDRAS